MAWDVLTTGYFTACLMAKSQARTKVTVLRATIGLTVKEFAQLLGRSVHTVNSLESGRLQLSDGLAAKVREKTGVALSWLLDETQTGPPVSFSGELLMRKEYERHQATILAEAIPRKHDASKAGLCFYTPQICLEVWMRADDHFALRLALNECDHAMVEVDVFPAQIGHVAEPCAGRESADDCAPPIASRCFQECAHLL